jgi:hypothetical protein
VLPFSSFITPLPSGYFPPAAASDAAVGAFVPSSALFCAAWLVRQLQTNHGFCSLRCQLVPAVVGVLAAFARLLSLGEFDLLPGGASVHCSGLASNL